MKFRLAVRPRLKTPGIYEPTDEREAAISLMVVLRISFAAHINIIATTPGSSRPESRCDQNQLHPQLHRDIALFGESRSPNWSIALSDRAPMTEPVWGIDPAILG